MAEVWWGQWVVVEKSTEIEIVSQKWIFLSGMQVRAEKESMRESKERNAMKIKYRLVCEKCP
jgi:hypothetical protein